MDRQPESPRYVLILGGLFLIAYAAYQVGSAWMAALPPAALVLTPTQPYPAPESVITPVEPYPGVEATVVPVYPYPAVEDTEMPLYPYPYPDSENAITPAPPYPEFEITNTPAQPYPEPGVTNTPAQPYPEPEPTNTPAQSYPELELTITPANLTPTFIPTPTEVAPTQPQPTATPTTDDLPTHTPTNIPSATPVEGAYPGPEQTSTPVNTETPNTDNPYPGPGQTSTPVNTATSNPDSPYPGPEQTNTPQPPTPSPTPQFNTPTATPTTIVLPTLEYLPAALTTLPFTETRIISNGSVNQAIWLDDGSSLALATSNGVYIRQPGEDKPRILDSGSSIVSVALISGQDWIAAGGRDSIIRLWEGSTGSYIARLQGHLLGVVRLSYAQFVGFLVSASDDATVRIWGIDGSLRRILRGPITRVVDMDLSSNAQMVASASNQYVHIWNPNTGDLLRTISQPTGWYTAAAFNPNSQILTTAYDGRRLEFWNTATWARVDVIPLNAPVQYLAYSRDGRWLAIGYTDGRIQIWDVYYEFIRADLAGHPKITSMAFSPFVDRLVSSSADGTIRFWDLTPLQNP